MSVHELVRCRVGMTQGRARTIARVVVRLNLSGCRDLDHNKHLRN